MSLFGLGQIVSFLSPDSITVQRPTESLQADGTYSESLSPVGTVSASVQPITGANAAAELELIGVTAGVTVYTQTDLQLHDRFTWGNRTYEIKTRHAWEPLGGFYEYKAGIRL